MKWSIDAHCNQLMFMFHLIQLCSCSFLLPFHLSISDGELLRFPTIRDDSPISFHSSVLIYIYVCIYIYFSALFFGHIVIVDCHVSFENSLFIIHFDNPAPSSFCVNLRIGDEDGRDGKVGRTETRGNCGWM